MPTGRRDVLKGVTGAAAAWATLGNGALSANASNLLAAKGDDRTPVRARDKFWVWGHVEGSHNNAYGLQGTSRMTPAEGAFYLGVPNVVFVAYQDPKEPCKMLPEESSFDAYAISFRPLKGVVWSIVGAGGIVNRRGVELVRQLSQKYANIVGVQMDDFFRNTLDGGRTGALTTKELAYIRTQLGATGRKLDLWVTLYHHDLKYDVSEYLNEVDVVTYWTWEAHDLQNLEEGFAEAEKAAPRARKVLGCYMWDYGTHQPMPVDLMEKQCQLGLEWLRRGRIEGMIFLTNVICDLNLDAVEWTRNWIREVGDGQL
jgi:hypothetical protein